MATIEREYRLPIDAKVTRVAVQMAELHQWHHGFLGIRPDWLSNHGIIAKPGRVQRAVRVAVLDTGVDTKHPDLQGRIVEAIDFTGSIWGPEDHNAHGTHCIGLIAANANDFGCRGPLHKAEIVAIKVLGDNGSGSDRQIARGLQAAADLNCDAVSMSLGSPRGTMGSYLQGVFKEIIGKTSVKFSFNAAGNDGGRCNEPAWWPTCIAVSACDEQGNLTPWSSWEAGVVDIIAPGLKILSTIPGGYGESSGTSMACPIVAAFGMGAWCKHESQPGGNPDLNTPADMAAHLQRTARRDPKDGAKYLLDPIALLRDEEPPIVPPVTSPGQPQPPGGGFEYPIPGLGITIRVPARAGDYAGIGAV